MYSEAELKQALLKEGQDAIADFLDMSVNSISGISDDDISVMIDDTIAQMPDDVFDEYYAKYVCQT